MRLPILRYFLFIWNAVKISELTLLRYFDYTNKQQGDSYLKPQLFQIWIQRIDITTAYF